MELKIKKTGSVIVIYLSGRLDVQNSISIEKEIHQLIQTEPGFHMLLNLFDVKYISSSGIRIFVSSMRVLKETGKKLKLCHMHDTVKKIFEVVELMDMFEIYETEEEALKSFNR